MKYATVLNDIKSDAFRRQDVLQALLKVNPDYNVGSFNRHFSKLLSDGHIENVGENLYSKVSPDTARKIYTYKELSAEFASVESLLSTKFPLADFLVLETTKLNEFFNHQVAQNTIIVTVERMLMDTIFEYLKEEFPSVMIAPRPEDLIRYGRNGSIIVEKLTSRYPKNPVQKRGYSIEKLIVDLFAEKMLRSVVNLADYPVALEAIFKKYRVNETRLFHYARTRHVDAEIRSMIHHKTAIRLYTEGRVI